MLFIKSVLLFAVLLLVRAEIDKNLVVKNVPKVYDENQKLYDQLVQCVTDYCSKTYKFLTIEDAEYEASEYKACQQGCISRHHMGKNCGGICKSFIGKQNDACILGCGDKEDNKEIKVVEVKPEIHQFDDIKAPPPAPEQEKPKVESPRPNIIDAIGALMNEKQDDSDKSESPNHLIEENQNFFNPFLINGQPVGSLSDPVFVDIKPIDENNDDDDSSSSSESNESKAVDPTVDEKKPEDDEAELPSSSFGFLNPFRIMNTVNRIIEKAKTKIGSGSFYYYAKLLENGTVIESFEKPTGSSEDIMKLDDNNNDDETPFKIIHALLNKNNHIGEDEDDDELGINRPGIHPNWKGRPLPIGKPIIEELNDHNRPPFRMYRECRPISFHFSTLCHDLNNFFNCVSMRTGLPRWFFMSLILLCSFFLLWLGIFMLSMIRRMKRQERIIQYEEDQLPLYKDIVFEEKRPPSYTDVEPLPEKVKLESTTTTA